MTEPIIETDLEGATTASVDQASFAETVQEVVWQAYQAAPLTDAPVDPEQAKAHLRAAVEAALEEPGEFSLHVGDCFGKRVQLQLEGDSTDSSLSFLPGEWDPEVQTFSTSIPTPTELVQAAASAVAAPVDPVDPTEPTTEL